MLAQAEVRPGEAAQGRVQFIRADDDLPLAVRLFGERNPDRLPVLCLAGLSRNSLDFLALANALASDPEAPRFVIATDSRGRGLSGRDRNWRNYNPLTEAADALTITTALGIDRAVVVGTSRGGILAMMIGSMRPGLLAGVVLNDIGPQIEGTGLARIKTYLSASQTVPNWDAAVNQVKAIAGKQFPALTQADFEAYTRALYVPGKKGLEPSFDRALLKTLKDLDFSENIPSLWPQFSSLLHVPLLAIRGEHSDLLSPRTISAMADLHPEMEQMTVLGQGHAPLLRDEPTIARMRDFVGHCDLG